jgi:hypothetical protein
MEREIVRGRRWEICVVDGGMYKWTVVGMTKKLAEERRAGYTGQK